ncbi:transcription factor bHLH144 [Ricinus communis]|uniref:transcription factor bHLH144 n=1 Tax=Ricinus communis TaxID=3988 RepID=UPI00201B287E|nr:transcription factor bHLH144 [Ricinus communis]XP_015575002.2 transcription factor bHLH144 [Ricinus communis]
MQSDQHFRRKKAVPHFANQRGNNYMHVPVASSFPAAPPPAAKHLMPVHGIEFQPSEVCPKNFIIFDQTDHRSQIMFHPTVAHRFNGPGLNMHASYFQENYEREAVDDTGREMSSLKEDSDDIDALLSLEEEEQDECDEEEVSTARTYGNYGSSSPDSCSTYGSKPRKTGSSSVQKSPGSGSSCSTERKRQKMKKMVKALRGIVPGGDQMNTVTVLDEAVRYLKSLKVEVQKIGVGNLKN